MSKLVHHGIKGQRWGVRRYQNEDGSLTAAGKKKRAENYTDQQYNADKYIYSKGAANRINKRMLEGEKVSAARSKEADRISATRRAANVSGKVGKVAGGVAGVVGGYYLSNKLMDLASKHNLAAYNDPVVRVITYSSVMSGSAKIGSLLGKYGGQSAAMLAGGYNPNKYRDGE